MFTELKGTLIMTCFKITQKTSLTMPLFIEVSVPSQQSKQSCICVLGVSILPVSTICLLDFGTVPTVWYFFSILLQQKEQIIVFPILEFQDFKKKTDVMYLHCNFNCLIYHVFPHASLINKLN